MQKRIPPPQAVGILAAVVILVLTFSTALLLWDLRQREIAHARLETVNLAHMLVEQTDKAFVGLDLYLRAVAERMHTPYGQRLALDSPEVRLLLGSRIAEVRQASSTFIADAQGFVRNTTHPRGVLNISVADREYFRYFADSQQDNLFISSPTQNRIDTGWTLFLARRLTTPSGGFRGIVVAAINLDRFEKVFDFMTLDFERPIALYLANHRLIASMPRRDAELGQPAVELERDFSTLNTLSETEVSLIEQPDGKGGTVDFAISRVPGLPLLVSVTNDEKAALEPWRDVAVPITTGAGVIGLFILIIAIWLQYKLRRDIEARLAAEAEIRASNRQLQELSTALQNVREQERKHLARELHDELGQQLTGLKLDLSWLQNRIKEGRVAEPERVQAMRRLLDDAVGNVRRISSELRPRILDDVRFGDALTWLSGEFSKRSDLTINLDLPAADLVADEATAIALFRVMQESLTNVVCHAQASRVDIRLTEEAGYLKLEICDNGCGLVEAGNTGSSPGIGVISMRERILALKGRFGIRNGAQGGMVIEAAVPLAGKDTKDAEEQAP